MESFKLRDYQDKNSYLAVEVLKKHKLVYLAYEVRTGKTLTALETANKYGCDNVLFITKKKAVGSIVSDYNLLQPDYTLDVFNYGSEHKITDKYDLVVIDEAHSLGAYPKPSNRTKKISSICKNTPIIYLSGTPTPESYSQIFHQMFISSYSPFYRYKNFYGWAKDYVNITQKFIHSNPINCYDDADKNKIDNVLKDIILTFTQKQAGFNQEVKETILTVRMKPIIYKIAKTLSSDLVYKGNNDAILADTPVKLMSKLHQLYSGTIKLESGNSCIIDDTKALFIKDKFKGKKIAIFYKFKAEYDLLKSVFVNHTSSPEEFKDSDNLVFLSQIQSGREGVNLSSADSLVMYNIDFSAVSYWQGRDRMTSKDRVKENRIYWIFSIGGIEKLIHKAVNKKQDFTKKYFMDVREQITN